MRSIYFHIGYPRSGSTFIQKNYFSSKEKNINFISREFNHGKEDYNTKRMGAMCCCLQKADDILGRMKRQ